MADPKEEEKIEKKVEETSKATHDNELTEADVENVAGGASDGECGHTCCGTAHSHI